MDGRLLFPVLVLAWAGAGLTGCSQNQRSAEALEVRSSFQSLQAAILSHHANQAVSYLPQNVSDYLVQLKSGDDASTPSEGEPVDAPGVSLLLRTALDRKMAPDVRSHLDLSQLLQRASDHGLLDCREVRDLSLGRVFVQDDRASAELYFQGKLLPLRLSFVREDRVWKVDLLAMLPYAEVLMRVDRALTGQTEREQVAQLVEPLPVL